MKKLDQKIKELKSMEELQLSTEAISMKQYEVARSHKDFKFRNENFNIHLMFSKDGVKTFAKSTDGYIEINDEDLKLSQNFDSNNEGQLDFHLFFDDHKLLFSANGDKTYVVYDDGLLKDSDDLIADHMIKESEYPTISNPFEYTFELFKNLKIKSDQDEFLVAHCIRLLNKEEEIIIAETYPDLFVHYLDAMMSLGGKDDFDLTLSYLTSYNKIKSKKIIDYLDKLIDYEASRYTDDEIGYYKEYLKIINDRFPYEDDTNFIECIRTYFTEENEGNLFPEKNKKRIEDFYECRKIIIDKLNGKDFNIFLDELIDFSIQQYLIDESIQHTKIIKEKFPKYFVQYQQRKAELIILNKNI